MYKPSRANEKFGIYQTLNRGNLRAPIFHKKDDYIAFDKIFGEASIDLADCETPELGRESESMIHLGKEELEAVRGNAHRRQTFGDPSGVESTARRFQLESTLRPRGRPKTTPEYKQASKKETDPLSCPPRFITGSYSLQYRLESINNGIRSSLTRGDCL